MSKCIRAERALTTAGQVFCNFLMSAGSEQSIGTGVQISGGHAEYTLAYAHATMR